MNFSFDTYYLHYHKNVQRYAYLEKYVKELLPGTVICEYDKGKFNPDDFYKYNYKDNFVAINSIIHILDYNIRLIEGIRSPEIKQIDVDIKSPSQYKSNFIRQLTPGQISLTNLSLNLKHRHCWNIISSLDSEYGLILEDDVIFKDNSIDQILSLLECDDIKYFDYIDLAGGCMLKPIGQNFNKFNSSNIYSLSVPSTRTTCAYLISKNLASHLIKSQQKIMFPIDFQLTYCLNLLDCNVGWIDPEIFIHGSEHGYYNTSNPKT